MIERTALREFAETKFDEFVGSGDYTLQLYDEFTDEPLSEEVEAIHDGKVEWVKNYSFNWKRIHRFKANTAIKYKDDNKVTRRVIGVLKRNNKPLMTYSGYEISTAPNKYKLSEVSVWIED